MPEGRVREKVIVVLDCFRKPGWTRRQVMENAPTWIESVLGEDSTRGRDADDPEYYFDNAFVYMSISDFELDRFDGEAHFASDQLEFWKPPIEEER